METFSTNNKHELKDILSSLMEECDIDDAQLARETGIPASTISRIRTNSKANPTASTLRPISKFFSISISQLLGDEPLPKDRLPGTHNPTYFTTARMPIIEWEWIMSWVTSRSENIKVKLQTWISTEKEVGPNTFALIIPTDSFGIAFRKGSTIIVDPSQYPVDGDLILIKIENEKNILLKQFLRDGFETYLRSVNPDIKNIMPLTESYTIIGTVIETRFSLQAVGKTPLQKEEKLEYSFANSALLKPTKI